MRTYVRSRNPPGKHVISRWYGTGAESVTHIDSSRAPARAGRLTRSKSSFIQVYMRALITLTISPVEVLKRGSRRVLLSPHKVGHLNGFTHHRRGEPVVNFNAHAHLVKMQTFEHIVAGLESAEGRRHSANERVCVWEREREREREREKRGGEWGW